MSGKVITLVGQTGSGKTTHVKDNYLKKTQRKKYTLARIKDDYTDLKGQKSLLSLTEFLDIFIKQVDSVGVMDEAYSYLPKTINVKNKQDEKIITTLLNARKLNNFIFIIYHSLRQVPLWVLDYSDYLLRFPTNDQLQFQKQRFQSFPNIIDSLENFPEIEKFQFDEIKIK